MLSDIIASIMHWACHSRCAPNHKRSIRDGDEDDDNDDDENLLDKYHDQIMNITNQQVMLK